ETSHACAHFGRTISARDQSQSVWVRPRPSDRHPGIVSPRLAQRSCAALLFTQANKILNAIIFVNPSYPATERCRQIRQRRSIIGESRIAHSSSHTRRLDDEEKLLFDIVRHDDFRRDK